MSFINGASQFGFAVSRATDGPTPSIGAPIDPVSGLAYDRSGFFTLGTLDSEHMNDVGGGFLEIRDSESFHKALSASMEASGKGWGGSIEVTADASSTSDMTATSHSIFFSGYRTVRRDTVSRQTALHPTLLAVLTAAQASGNYQPFWDTYGTHFVSGYIYGHTMNLSSTYDFKSSVDFEAFSASLTADYGSPGFNASISGAIASAQTRSRTSARRKIDYYSKGVNTYDPPADDATLQAALKAFGSASEADATPIMLIVEPWTALDAVQAFYNKPSIIDNDTLKRLADKTNDWVFVRRTADNFIKSGSFAGATQRSGVQTLLDRADQTIAAISNKLQDVAIGGAPLSQGDVDAFASGQDAITQLHKAMTSFVLNVKISGSGVNSPIRDTQGRIVTVDMLRGGVDIWVDWSTNDDPNVKDPQVSRLLAGGAYKGVYYVVLDRTNGTIRVLAQADDSDGPKWSPPLMVRREQNASQLWMFNDYTAITLTLG